jgi:hypothetical protein
MLKTLRTIREKRTDGTGNESFREEAEVQNLLTGLEEK